MYLSKLQNVFVHIATTFLSTNLANMSFLLLPTWHQILAYLHHWFDLRIKFWKIVRRHHYIFELLWGKSTIENSRIYTTRGRYIRLVDTSLLSVVISEEAWPIIRYLLLSLKLRYIIIRYQSCLYAFFWCFIRCCFSAFLVFEGLQSLYAIGQCQ